VTAAASPEANTQRPAFPSKLVVLDLYLHDCSGCDLDIGRQLGADQVLVAWVSRVSALILSLTYEFHDVASEPQSGSAATQ
jgi:hypothetical protein